MEEPGLGYIEKVELREAWPHEAADFTPWLAEHISKLGDALGLELELQLQEAPIGTFSLDLLARESETNRTVIIENQLEPTNHDHLGKLLTYAGGSDANVIIWIAKDFRDEHRQALDWLNQRTDEDTEFFGVVVEVWRIDDSRPAPHFNLVATPNEWRREATDSVRMVNASERNRRYRSFFQNLIDALNRNGFNIRGQGQPQNWCKFSAGHRQGVQYGAVFNSGGRVVVGVYINSNDTDWNETLFDNLRERQDAIQAELDEILEWDRLEDRREIRIFIRRQGSIDDDEESLEELKDWMIGQLLDFRRIFGPHLAELAR